MPVLEEIRSARTRRAALKHHLSWLLVVLSFHLTLPSGTNAQTAPAPSPPISEPNSSDSPTSPQSPQRDSPIPVKEILTLFGGAVAILAFLIGLFKALFAPFLKAALSDKSVIEMIARQGRFASEDNLAELKDTMGEAKERLGILEAEVGNLQQPTPQATFEYLVLALSSPSEQTRLMQLLNSPIAAIAAESVEKKVQSVLDLVQELKPLLKKKKC